MEKLSISDESRPDLDSLLETLLPFAEDQLRKRGFFAPFAASVDSEGQMALAMAYPDSHDTPTSDLIMMVKKGFHKKAVENAIRAAAICYDGRLRPVSGGKARDAVFIDMERKCGDVVTIAVPYTKKFLKRIEFGDIVALPAESSIFVLQSDDAA
jgi:hypothetical protein